MIQIETLLLGYDIIYAIILFIWCWFIYVKDVRFHPLIDLGILVGLFIFVFSLIILLPEAIRLVEKPGGNL